MAISPPVGLTSVIMVTVELINSIHECSYVSLCYVCPILTGVLSTILKQAVFVTT